MMRRIFQAHSGFTLIEMIIVILIMAILAVVVIPQIAGIKRDAALTNLKGDLAVMRKAVEIYYVQHNSTYPGAKSIALA